MSQSILWPPPTICRYIERCMTINTLPDGSPVALSEPISALIATIKTVLTEGRQRAKQALEQEKLTMYWHIGQHIKAHLLVYSERADYGKKLVQLLTTQLDVGMTDLYMSVRLYDYYPEILHSSAKFTWTHAKTLLRIKSDEKRQGYEERIEAENLSVNELKVIIKDAQQVTPRAPKVLTIERGAPYTYRLIHDSTPHTRIDLGFRISIDSPVQNLTTTSVFESFKQGTTYTFTNMQTTRVPFYTYKAQLFEIIDGDTIWASIDLGFGCQIRCKLRFRGINAQEQGSLSGDEAKHFVEKRLLALPFIVVKTYWRDKFNRYLADVFYLSKTSNLAETIKNGHFLNQELIAAGLG